MTIIDAQQLAHGGADATVQEIVEEVFPVDADRALDLTQQGFTSGEIAELLGSGARAVERALDARVPGGSATIRAALRRRLRAWHSDHEEGSWLAAEDVFGIAHSNILSLARAPRADETPPVAVHEAGYLDAVLAGAGCSDQRARASARAYAMGATLQDLGDHFGVTRERIRQLLTQQTPWSSTEIALVLRRLRAARRAERTRAVQQWSHQHPAAPVHEAVAALGMSQAQVLDLLGRRRSRHVPSGARGSRRHSDEDVLADVREYHEQTGSTTATGFTQWAREAGVPGHQTASIRFGTWNDALRAAGLARTAGARRSSYTEEDLWAAVVAVVRAPDGGTTARAAEDWLARHPAAPSLALIRQRLGMPWSQITATALAVVRQDGDLDPAWVRAIGAPRDWDAMPEPVEDLQHVRDAVAEIGTVISTQRFTVWAREKGRPTLQTLQRRTGRTWSQLLADAGGEPARRGTGNRSVGAHGP